MHEVYFDRTYIYGVTDVDEGAERNISVYDGLEYGNFPVAENKDLHNWTVQCELTETREPKHSGEWTDARSIFKKLERVLNSKNPKRLIITSDYGKTSKQVLLESYTKSEKGYSGVYDVTLKFVEYKEVGIRTEDVPYIPRPGKVPTPPPVITINSKNGVTPYGVQRKYSDKTTSMLQAQRDWALKQPATGKPVNNPCTLEDGSKVNYVRLPTNAVEAAWRGTEIYGTRVPGISEILTLPNKWLRSAADAMTKPRDDFKNKWREENQERINSLKK